MLERRRKNIQQYIVKSPIFKLLYKCKTYEKYVVFNRQNFTRASNLSEITPTGEIHLLKLLE